MDTITDAFVGKKIGRYTVEAVLGRGRGAAVYRGFDPVVNREVAIKVLDPSAAKNRALVDAFLRDTGTLAKLRHPHILPIYEVAEHGGTAYVVRQLTDGGTLRSRLQAGMLSVGDAAAILRPVATALDYAHRQGIVHRNLRPTNILLTGDGHAFITDFSLPEGERGNSAATTVVNVTTEPEYVSPEQIRGAALDGRSDIYVLAVILYEALVGRPPFRVEGTDETSRTVITRHLQEEPPAPSAFNPVIGPQVDAVLLRGLAKDPEKRYPNAAALFYALSEAEEQDRTYRRRQRGNSGPLSPAEASRPTAVATGVPASPAPALSPPPPATPGSSADLDDLLATLLDVDGPAAETPAAGAPPAAPAPASRPSPPAPKGAEAAPSQPPTAKPSRSASVPSPTPATAKRLPVLPIAGGVALVVVVLVVALIALNRGEQPAQAQATQPAPVASTSAAPVVNDPAPTATTAAPQATAVVASAAPSSAAPSAVAPSAVAPSASAAATVAVAASQPAAPVRREMIVYSEQAVGGLQAQIVAVGADGQGPQTLVTLPGNAWGARIAPDGRSVLFSVGSGATPDQTHLGGMVGRGQHDLYLANLDGSAPVRLTNGTAWNVGWSWSPDGKSLAFTSNRDGNWEVYVMSFPSQEVRRLTNNAAQDAWPSWTADGQQLIFMSTRDSYPQLYRMNADGSGVARLLTSESSDTGPVVSPDGKQIAYVAQTFGTNDSDIFVANIDGSGATRLTESGNNYQPTWSPDSSRIAFTSTRDGNYNIYTMRADGSGLTRVTDDAGDEVTPAWGTIELPAGSASRAPTADLPFGAGALALATGTTRRKLHAGLPRSQQ
jgi:serine/threonine-protein kinase